MLAAFVTRRLSHITRGGVVAIAMLASGCGDSGSPETSKIGGFEVDDSDRRKPTPDQVATRPRETTSQRPATAAVPRVGTKTSTPGTSKPGAPSRDTRTTAPAGSTVVELPARPATSSGTAASAPKGTNSNAADPGTPSVGQSQQPRPRGSRVLPPRSVSGEQLSSRDIPTDSPKKIQAFIERIDIELARISDPRMSPEAVRAKVMPLLNSKLTAAERILELPSEEGIREIALKAKLDVLTQFQFLTTEDLTPRFKEFGEQLRNEKNTKFARQGRFVLLRLQMQRIQEKKETNVAAFVDEVKAIITEEEPDISVFETVHGCAMALESIGRHELAQEVMLTGATKFSQSKDPRMAIEGNIMLDHLTLTKTKFFVLIEMVVAKRSGAMAELTTAIQETFAARKPSRYILRNLAGATAQFEIAERFQECRDLYDIMEQSYTGHEDPEVAEEGTNLAKNGKVRLNLLGKPFAVEGVQVNGMPFDWSAYRGKVVLVEFWATTNAGCVEEIPKIKQAYELYKDKGFTVVGVNLDEDVQRLNRFLVRNRLPWTTVISPDPMARGYDSPMAVRCGVDQLPFLVLVDQNGTAIALNTVDYTLRQQLQELLGPIGEETPRTSIPNGRPSRGAPRRPR